MEYSESLDYLFSLQRMGARLGTRTVSALLARLGDPQSAYPSVLIAGTNGKGSTAAFLASILRAAGLGYAVGGHDIVTLSSVTVNGPDSVTFDELVTVYV